MNFIIKKENLLDVKNIVFEIDNKAFSRSFDISARDVNEELRYLTGCEVYLAYMNNMPVGFFTYKVQDNKVEVMQIAVLPEFQRQCIGSRMMDKLLHLVNGKKIELVTHPYNSSGIMFYLKHGFQICSWKDNYFGDGQPRLLLRRIQET